MISFVTGATGFIGSHLVDSLLQRGHRVRCLVRSPGKAQAMFGDRDLEIVEGHLDDHRALEQGCAEADFIFHVAALVAARNEREFHLINVDATARLARTAEKNSPGLRRFVYVSSLAAAGPTPRGTILNDPDRNAPVTHYGRSKLEGEKAVRAAGLPYVILRPPTVYGPRDTEMFKIFKAARYKLMPVFGDGLQELSLVYAADLANALVLAAESGRNGTVYYPAHEQIVTPIQISTTIYRAVKERAEGRPKVIHVPPSVARVALAVTGSVSGLLGKTTLLTADKAHEFLAPAWTCDPETLRQDTGWSADCNLETGIDRTARWYKDAGWL